MIEGCPCERTRKCININAHQIGSSLPTKLKLKRKNYPEHFSSISRIFFFFFFAEAEILPDKLKGFFVRKNLGSIPHTHTVPKNHHDGISFFFSFFFLLLLLLPKIPGSIYDLSVSVLDNPSLSDQKSKDMNPTTHLPLRSLHMAKTLSDRFSPHFQSCYYFSRLQIFHLWVGTTESRYITILPPHDEIQSWRRGKAQLNLFQSQDQNT